MADDLAEFERSRVLNSAQRSQFTVTSVTAPIRSDTSLAKFGRSSQPVVTTISPRASNIAASEQRLQPRSPFVAASASSSFDSSISLVVPPESSRDFVRNEVLGHDDADEDDGDTGLLRSLIGRKPGHLQLGSSPSPQTPHAAPLIASSSTLRASADYQRDATLELADLSSSSASAADDATSLPPTFAVSVAPRQSSSSPKTLPVRSESMLDASRFSRSVHAGKTNALLDRSREAIRALKTELAAERARSRALGADLRAARDESALLRAECERLTALAAIAAGDAEDRVRQAAVLARAAAEEQAAARHREQREQFEQSQQRYRKRVDALRAEHAAAQSRQADEFASQLDEARALAAQAVQELDMVRAAAEQAALGAAEQLAACESQWRAAFDAQSAELDSERDADRLVLDDAANAIETLNARIARQERVIARAAASLSGLSFPVADVGSADESVDDVSAANETRHDEGEDEDEDDLAAAQTAAVAIVADPEAATPVRNGSHRTHTAAHSVPRSPLSPLSPCGSAPSRSPAPLPAHSHSLDQLGAVIEAHTARFRVAHARLRAQTRHNRDLARQLELTRAELDDLRSAAQREMDEVRAAAQQRVDEVQSDADAYRREAAAHARELRAAAVAQAEKFDGMLLSFSFTRSFFKFCDALIPFEYYLSITDMFTISWYSLLHFLVSATSTVLFLAFVFVRFRASLAIAAARPRRSVGDRTLRTDRVCRRRQRAPQSRGRRVRRAACRARGGGGHGRTTGAAAAVG
jgi:hypothetical protein